MGQGPKLVAVEISLTPIIRSDAGPVMAVVHEVAARAGLERALGDSVRAAGALDAIADPYSRPMLAAAWTSSTAPPRGSPAARRKRRGGVH